MTLEYFCCSFGVELVSDLLFVFGDTVFLLGGGVVLEMPILEPTETTQLLEPQPDLRH